MNGSYSFVFQLKVNLYAPAGNVRYYLVFGSSVCLLFCPTYKVQYLKFGWSYSNQT